MTGWLNYVWKVVKYTRMVMKRKWVVIIYAWKVGLKFFEKVVIIFVQIVEESICKVDLLSSRISLSPTTVGRIVISSTSTETILAI